MYCSKFKIKRLFAMCLIVNCSLFIFYHSNDYKIKWLGQIVPREVEDKNIILLDELTVYMNGGEDAFEEKYGKNVIFYVLTDGRDQIHHRFVCAIESTSKLNPEMQVMLIFAKPATRVNLTENLALAETLKNSSNIHLASLDMPKAFDFFNSSELFIKMNSSKFRLTHLSNYVRILLLRMFGGIYADVDYIMIKNMHLFLKNNTNFIMAESSGALNTAFIGFERNHSLATKIMQNTERQYVPGYRHTCLHAFATLIMELTKTKKVSVAVKLGRMGDVAIFNSTYLHKVEYQSFQKLFSELKDDVEDFFKESFGVHYWNELSRKAQLSLTSNAPLAKMARTYCPRSFGTVTGTYW